MRKTFVSLGLAASVHILPAAAHSAGPVAMPATTGFSTTHAANPALTHASFVTQHHAVNQATLAVIGSHANSAASGFNSHQVNFNQVQNNSAQLFAQVGEHSWAAAQAVQLTFHTISTVGGPTLNLDLSSTQASLSAANFLKGESVTITVGGQPLVVTAKSQLTPAEYLSAQAVAGGQTQSLVIGASGDAVGGSLVVSQRIGQTVSSLVIPQGVTVTDFSRSGTIKVAGDISDAGTLYVAGSPATGITLNAANVNVASGAVLSDSFAGSGTPSGLTINTTGAINNAGTIDGGAGLNLTSATGTIVNSGLVSASTGSITLSAPKTVDLTVNGAGGTFSAQSGDINIRETGYAGVAATTLNGGNFLANNLNINGGEGTIEGNLGQVSGQLNTIAGVAHVSADSNVLSLGNQSISGDPTYANTGDIAINGVVDVSGANLAILAGGNVYSNNSDAAIVDHAGNVTIIAGASITGGGTGGGSVNSGSTSTAATGNVTVSLTGGNGGNIDFTGASGGTASNSFYAIDTKSATTGGSVTLVALANGNTGGSVLFNTGGTNGIITSGAQAGNLTVIGGAASGVGIQLSSITAVGTNQGGNVSLTVGQALTNDGKSFVFDTNGSIISFNHVVAGALTNGQINYGMITASGAIGLNNGGSGGNVSIASGGNVNGGAIIVAGDDGGTRAGGNGGTVGIAAGGTIDIGNVSTHGGSGANITNVTYTSNLAAPQSNGGSIVISGAGSVSIGNLYSYGGNGVNSGAGGQGGLISVSSTDGAVTLGGVINSNGGNASSAATDAPSGGSAGAIILTAVGNILGNSITAITANGGSSGIGTAAQGATSVSGNGGEILLVAGQGVTLNQSGLITAKAGSTNSSSSTIGSSGSVTAVGADEVLTGPINVDGNGGKVTLICTNGPVSISSGLLSAASISALNGGVVTLVGNSSIALNSTDSSGNVMITDSAFISAGSSSTIYLAGGNIVANGTDSAGEVWVLNASGSVGSYTVNGAANINQWTTGTGVIGDSPIEFFNGLAPTNYYGGVSTIQNDSGSTLTIRSDNSDMLVPLVSGQTATLAGSITANVAIGIFTSGTVSLTSSSPDASFDLPMIVSASNQASYISPQSTTSFGTIASLGNVTVNAPGSVTITGSISGQNITVNSSNFSTAETLLGGGGLALAPGGTISVNYNGQIGGSSTVGGNFYTGGTGHVNIINTDGSIILHPITANTPLINLQAHNFNIGYELTFNGGIVGINNTASGGAITLQNPDNWLILNVNSALFKTDNSGSLTMGSPNGIGLNGFGNAQTTTLMGGGDLYLESPNLSIYSSIVATGQSNVFIDAGSSTPNASLTMTYQEAEIKTNGGIIAFHPTGDLNFDGQDIYLSAFGTNGNGLIDVQAMGNVNFQNGTAIALNSPLQVNVNAGENVTFENGASLTQYFSGNASFPDPLGGTFQYSILFQNLITNFNIGGTGSIIQTGATPGNTVFNDFVDVGINNGTNLTFLNQYTDQSTQSGYVNFFTRQIQVNGSVGDSYDNAAFNLNNIQALNFNTNLPSAGPGNLAFQGSILANSASLIIGGSAPVNIGFSGTTPPASIPALQQPVGNLNFGLGGSFVLQTGGTANINVAGTIYSYTGSSLYAGGNLNVATTTGSNGLIILGGALQAPSGNLTIHADGSAGIIGAGGYAGGQQVTLSSDLGSIGAFGAPINVYGTGITASTGYTSSGSGGIYLNSNGAVNLVGVNNAGSSGTFYIVSPQVTVASGATLSGNGVEFVTGKATITGDITAGGIGLYIHNTGDVSVTGNGKVNSPSSIDISGTGSVNVGLPAAVLNSTNRLTFNAGTTLTLPSTTLSVVADANGNGGVINISAATIVTTSGTGPLTLLANGTTRDGGQINYTGLGTGTVVVGGGTGNISASANAGSAGGNGGEISIDVAGNLTVDMSKLSFTATGNGNGGGIELIAGTGTAGGNLVVTGAIHADGAGTGQGGIIDLESTSKTLLTIGTAKSANGSSGALTASGQYGRIFINNNGTGGIAITQPLTAFESVYLYANANATTGGGIKISAPIGNTNTSQISIDTSGAGKITTAATAPLMAGTIEFSTGSGAVVLGNVAALPNTSITGSTTGSLAVTGSGANPLGLYSISVGSMTVKTAGNILTESNVSAVKNISLTTTGTNSAIIVEDDLSTTGSGSITLSAPSSTAQYAIDQGAGKITAGGALVLSAAKGGIKLSDETSAVNIKATAATTINQPNGTLAGVKGVTLTTSSTANGAGGITVSNITTGIAGVTGSVGGAINVTAAGGVLTVNPGGVIQAFSDKTTKATVTLENKLVKGTTTGSIVINDDAQITTSGAYGSNIAISMGAAGSPKAAPLTPVAGVTFSPNTSPPIYLGASGVNFQTSGGANQVNVNVIGNGVKVIINTGGLPASAITINGGINNPTLIQADPPPAVTTPLTPGPVHIIDTAASVAPISLGSTTSLIMPTFQTTARFISQPAETDGNELVGAITSARTLYGAATLDAISGDEGPLSYSIKPVTDKFNGAVVIAGDQASTTETQYGPVQVAAGAVAMIVAGPQTTAVYNLHDTHGGSVTITVGDELIKIAPGRHATITTRRATDFHSANLMTDLGYRNITTRNIETGNLQAFCGEFSLPAAIGQVRQLRELVNDASPRAKKLAGGMLKTAAILNQLNRNSQFERFVPAEVTAMAR